MNGLFESQNGSVRATLRFLRANPFGVRFALDVTNATTEPILATVYAQTHGGQEIPIHPYTYWIEPERDGSLELPLPWLTAISCTALLVRLQGRNVHHQMKSAMPRPTALIAFVAGAASVAAAFGIIGALQPHVKKADVPPIVVVMTPRPTVAPPRIISFILESASVPDGGTVVARYRVSADSGDVLAVDAQGTIWAQAAIKPDGITRLALPVFRENKELQIRLLVRRGPRLVAAGIGLETIAQ